MKRPCAKCRNRGAVFKPTRNSNDWQQVIACDRCNRFRTDLEAARWYYKQPKVVEFDEAIAVVGEEKDRWKEHWPKVAD